MPTEGPQIVEKKCAHQLLCKALKAFVSDGNIDGISHNVDWKWLDRIARRYGLFAILLETLPEALIPPSIAKRWQSASMKVLINNTCALNAATQLFALLEQENIPAVALRGIALAHAIYRDPVQRPMADVDILIPANAQRAFLHLMQKYNLGPVKCLRSQFVFSMDRVKFEIHYSLLTPKRYRNAADFNAWTTDRLSINTPMGSLYRLAPEKELLALACHWCIHHELEGFLPAIDIALLVSAQSLDWSSIRSWCAQNHLNRLIYFTIAYVEYLLDMTLPGHSLPLAQNLPKQSITVFDAYLERSIGKDNLSATLRRKINMLFMAELASTKIRQGLRFFDIYSLMKQL